MATNSKSNGHSQVAGEGGRPVKPAVLWAGRVLSALPVLVLLMSAGMKLSQSEEVVTQFAKFGYPVNTLVAIGVVEIVCTLLYVIPQTSVLGAILLTGYLGGAVSTHVRVPDPFIAPIVIGIVLWLGLYLRDARLRALLPLRR